MSSAFSPYESNESLRHASSSTYVDKMKRPYHREGSLIGYTGYYPHDGDEEHVLNSPSSKYMIRGYTGHRPYRRAVVGEPIVPNEDKQVLFRSQRSSPLHQQDASLSASKVQSEDTEFGFRSFAKHMDTLERYATAVQQLMDRGQNQEMLLRIVQAKMSERVNSYAHQLVRTRKIFETFDINKDGVLDEAEFRICLEKMNIQFDDVQVLALFAYFDHNNDGFVEWEDFADHSMVYNPRGGTAVLPKVIIATAQSHQREGVSSKNLLTGRPMGSRTPSSPMSPTNLSPTKSPAH